MSEGIESGAEQHEREARDWEMKAQGIESVIHYVVSKRDQDVLRQRAADKRVEGKRLAARHAQTAPQPGQVVAYRTLDRYGNPVTDWIDGDPAGGEPIVSGGSFQMAYGATQQVQSGPGPVDLAAEERQLRQEFESRWPVPKGVTWAAGVGDYCVSEFAAGIALSYPDMWMAYKAGAARVNA